jgi:hypothetical protein
MSNRKMTVALLGSFGAGVAFVLACGASMDSAGDPAAVDGGAGVQDECARCEPPDLGPVEVVQPVRVVTADTDVVQMETGQILNQHRVDPPTGTVEGPLVITDLWTNPLAESDPPVARAHFVPMGKTCERPYAIASFTLAAGETIMPIHGARLFLPAGYRLCGESSYVRVGWAGVRPYTGLGE